MKAWKQIIMRDFLKEPQGRCKSGDRDIIKYQHFDRQDFSDTIHIPEKYSKTGMIIIRTGNSVTATAHYFYIEMRVADV